MKSKEVKTCRRVESKEHGLPAHSGNRNGGEALRSALLASDGHQQKREDREVSERQGPQGQDLVEIGEVGEERGRDGRNGLVHGFLQLDRVR